MRDEVDEMSAASRGSARHTGEASSTLGLNRGYPRG